MSKDTSIGIIIGRSMVDQGVGTTRLAELLGVSEADHAIIHAERDRLLNDLFQSLLANPA